MHEAEALLGDGTQSTRRLLPEAQQVGVQDIRDALVIRERDLFLLTDTAGQVPPGNNNGYGLYYEDTRYLSAYEFSFSTARPLVLLSTAALGYSSEQVLTNASMTDLQARVVPRGTIEVRRVRVLEDVLEETIEITNYNTVPVVLDLVLRFAADFADIFEVRGYQREKRGSLRAPAWHDSTLEMTYRGRDSRERQTLIFFTAEPLSAQTDLEGGTIATFRVSLAARQSATTRLVVTVDGRLEAAQAVGRFEIVAQEYDSWLQDATRIETDNDFFNAVLARSLADLRMLWNHQAAGRGYPAAGTPWYDTLFGRDTCIVGLQTLSLNPMIARDCLASVARWQGKKFDPWRDEEPGKILHELRQGELTQTGELPFSPYFGSVDSTPLFLWLAGEYFAWTGDRDLLAQLETNLRAALHWLTRYGDANSGYVDYEKRSSKGLVNQGWKDSEDCILHADGTIVLPPIALIEVAGYTYAAFQKLAPVFAALGDEETAAELLQKSATLKRRFNHDFRLANGFYALALDGAGHPASSVTSNPGHALWAGVIQDASAAPLVERLMREDMFSGWGIRTLSTESPRFNPQGYHTGAVWPHDNSIVAMGFKRYGFESDLNTVASGLFDAARAFLYYRLPELFGGAERSVHQAPVPYPVACRPQAWAAGAFPLITQAILGLCPDAANNRLFIVRPRLPDWLGSIRIEGLRVGSGEVNLYYERRRSRTVVHVRDTKGVSVEMVRRWPKTARPRPARRRSRQS